MKRLHSLDSNVAALTDLIDHANFAAVYLVEAVAVVAGYVAGPVGPADFVDVADFVDPAAVVAAGQVVVDSDFVDVADFVAAVAVVGSVGFAGLAVDYQPWCNSLVFALNRRLGFDLIFTLPIFQNSPSYNLLHINSM